ncbi:MAG: 4-(cytidine 5'-diphospho)-2-C-methyl-D-erythritol kinase [Proteobacteria bacterium]|jgi:4-diphosphocytidyl-2-C-methyl-D-erythritol kinase|nr:4-(cytidine 5'-diphospho)-2-C-methyl-D-erythritol kinase [Pseudomonadota bacterium]
MNARLTVPAPAKVNLFLHVTGRRPDGYHTLESLVALVDFADVLTIEVRGDARIERVLPVAGVAEADDLALRAARALREATGVARGASIAIAKRIPIGAGLGGGSSDAATTLIALNHLWGLHRPRAELAAIGVALGADVPFFLGEGAAVVRGIGEALTPASLPAHWIALALPPIAVPTASIFAAPELTRSAASAKMDVFSEGYGRNDLEAAARARFAPVGEALVALRGVTPRARMTGSGAGVIAAFATIAEAEAALAALPPAMPGRVVRTIERHPLAALS